MKKKERNPTAATKAASARYRVRCVEMLLDVTCSARRRSTTSKNSGEAEVLVLRRRRALKVPQQDPAGDKRACRIVGGAERKQLVREVAVRTGVEPAVDAVGQVQ